MSKSSHFSRWPNFINTLYKCNSRIVFFLVLMTATALLDQACTSNRTYYVAPGGSDQNDGSESHPFATLHKAVQSIGVAEEKQVTIYLRNGFYSLSKTILISDNGTNSLPVKTLVASYPGEKAYVTGGRKISGFVPIEEGSVAYQKLLPDSRSHVMQVDLKAMGMDDYGKITPRGFGRPIQPAGLELYFNGEPMTLARWPNDAWALIQDVPEALEGKGFIYSGDRPARWYGDEDVWMHGYWKWDWSDSYVKMARIDTVKREILTEPPHSNYPYKKGKRFYVFNILEELDTPGEWYLDRGDGILYFWPPSDPDNSEIYVALLRDPLIRLENANGVEIRDLTIEYACGAGIEIIGGSNNLVENCTIRNMGTVAVSIGKLEPYPGSTIYKNTLYNGDAGEQNGVSGCKFYNLGEGGIILGGGDRKTLAPGRNFVENSILHDCSRWVRTYRAGIFMYGVGNIVRHNEIYDLPHTAIFFWGNDHIIEYNEVHHVCMETGDAGALYLGRDWSQRGSLIRYNYFHHLHGVEGQSGWTDVMAIYLDDWASGTTIFGNVFYKAGRSIMIGGGRDNLVENNIVIDGQPAMHVDARGIGWAKYYFDGRDSTLFKRLAAVDPDVPPYSVKYPSLTRVLQDHPELPVGNCFVRNVGCGGKWLDLLNGINDTLVCFRDNRVVTDCGFFSPEGLPVKITYDPSVFPPGFIKIPVGRIGIVKKASGKK